MHTFGCCERKKIQMEYSYIFVSSLRLNADNYELVVDTRRMNHYFEREWIKCIRKKTTGHMISENAQFVCVMCVLWSNTSPSAIKFWPVFTGIDPFAYMRIMTAIMFMCGVIWCARLCTVIYLFLSNDTGFKCTFNWLKWACLQNSSKCLIPNYNGSYFVYFQ